MTATSRVGCVVWSHELVFPPSWVKLGEASYLHIVMADLGPVGGSTELL